MQCVPDIQPRETLNGETIADYARTYQEEPDAMPPIDVFFVNETYYCADGFHRVSSASQAGMDSIKCRVRLGTMQDAILHAIRANRGNALRYTNADKVHFVKRLLSTPDYAGMSSRELAKLAGVSNTFVSDLKLMSGHFL